MPQKLLNVHVDDVDRICLVFFVLCLMIVRLRQKKGREILKVPISRFGEAQNGRTESRIARIFEELAQYKK